MVGGVRRSDRWRGAGRTFAAAPRNFGVACLISIRLRASSPMLDSGHNLQVSGPVELDTNPNQVNNPAFVREAHQLMRYYVSFARRHWLLLVVLPLAGAAVAAAVTRLPADTYTATAKMLAGGDPAA